MFLPIFLIKMFLLALFNAGFAVKPSYASELMFFKTTESFYDIL